MSYLNDPENLSRSLYSQMPTAPDMDRGKNQHKLVLAVGHPRNNGVVDAVMTYINSSNHQNVQDFLTPKSITRSTYPMDIENSGVPNSSSF